MRSSFRPAAMALSDGAPEARRSATSGAGSAARFRAFAVFVARPRARPRSWFRRLAGVPSRFPRALAAASATLVRSEIILSDHGEDADDHLVGLRHVGRHETDVGLLKAE